VKFIIADKIYDQDAFIGVSEGSLYESVNYISAYLACN